MLYRALVVICLALGLAAGCGTSPEPDAPADAPPSESPSARSDSLRRPDLAPTELATVQTRESERATRALAEVDQRFARRPADLSFQVRRVMTTRLGDTHVLIQQVFRGVPVEGRDLVAVVYYPDEEIRVLGTPDAFDSVASIDRAAKPMMAAASAWASARSAQLRGDARRVIEPVYRRELRPGRRGDNADDYETIVDRFEAGSVVSLQAERGSTGHRELFVRERDGAVVARKAPPALISRLRGHWHGTISSIPLSEDGPPQLHDEDGDAVLAWPTPPEILPVEYISGTRTWGDNQLYSFGGTTTRNGQTAAADAMISLYATRRLLGDVFMRAGWDGLGTPVTALVHYPDNNSYSDYENRLLLLGYTGDMLPNGGLPNAPDTDIESVGHEFGHLTFEAATGSFDDGPGEMGGLNEGSADIFGLLAGFYLPTALNNNCASHTCSSPRPVNPRIDWVYGDPNNAPYFRSFVDPEFPVWSPAFANLDAHFSLGPYVRMYYFLSVGVLPWGQPPVAGLTNPQRESPFLQDGLVGLGLNDANWIWWNTLAPFYFARVHDYASMRAMMLEATMTLYGRVPHTPQYKAVQDAWAAVNVGFPADRDPPTAALVVTQTSPTAATVDVTFTDDTAPITGNILVSGGSGPNVTSPCNSHCRVAINPTIYGEGAMVWIYATDGANNVHDEIVSLHLDLTPPALSVVSHGPPFPSDATVQDLDITATDAAHRLSSMAVRLDGVTLASKTWNPPAVSTFSFPHVTMNVSNRAEGAYRLEIEAIDTAGNQRLLAQSLVVDHTPPESCALSISPDAADPRTLTFNLRSSDLLTGVGQLGLLMNGSLVFVSPYTSGPTRLDLDAWTSTFAPGTYTFAASCKDKHGNLTTSAPITRTIVAPCNSTAVAGGAAVDERMVEMGKTSGTVTLTYWTYTVHDRIKVFSGTTLVKDTGCVATGGDPSNGPFGPSTTFSYSGATTQLKVRVEPNCDPTNTSPNTEWRYLLSCP